MGGFRRDLSDKDWIRLRPSGIKYVAYAFFKVGYRLFPELMSMKLGKAIIVILQLLLVAAISLAPVIFQRYLAPAFHITIPPSSSAVANPWYQAALLFVLQTAKFGLDRLKAGSADAVERMTILQDLAVACDATVGAIERKIKEFANDPASEAEVKSFIQHALKCIEATVRLCVTTLDERHCSVTLMTFEAGDRMLIRARSKIERATGRHVSQNDTMAFLVAKYVADVGVVHNFRLAAWFRNKGAVKYRSLSSQASPKYESILFLPLPAVTVPGQHAVRKGVVTIDAARPYEFLGKEIDISVCVQAYLHLINIMLTNHCVGVEAETSS